ncbi:MAG TPA: membrane protein insertion efficiency factor YidD [Nocardioides sp.]|nr:membrane protein insertion efficiency factor YidD [Nocardioides sp.]
MGWWRDRRNRRTRRKRGRDCADGACDIAECADCSPFLLGLVLATIAGYRSTPPATGGRRSTRAMLRLIRSYQANVSAHRPAVCNLTPTCSNHALAVLQDRGPAALPEVRRRLRQCAEAGRVRRAVTG